MIASLAEQTGYWPVFSFLNDINHLVDLASVGLIGQKGAFSRFFPSLCLILRPIMVWFD